MTIDKDMESVEVKKVQLWKGYSAIDIRGVYNRINEESKKTTWIQWPWAVQLMAI